MSGARSPQEEEDNQLVNPTGLANGAGDSIWLSTSANLGAPAAGQFQRTVIIDGQPRVIPIRSVVLRFDASNYDQPQTVYAYAPDDLRAEGDRVVVTQHSVISNDPRFDAADVRNVEVAVHDNDTPGVYVTQVRSGTSIEDGRTTVIEGDATTGVTD